MGYSGYTYLSEQRAIPCKIRFFRSWRNWFLQCQLTSFLRRPSSIRVRRIWNTDPLFAVRCTINQPRIGHSHRFFFVLFCFVCLFVFSSFLSTTKPLNVLGYANSCKLHQRLMKGLIVDLTALCNVSMPTRNFRRRWNFKVIPLVAQFYPVLSFHSLAQFARRRKEGHRHRRTSCLCCFHGSILSVANSINTTEEKCIIRSPMRGGLAEQ
jgi:hypothetical protein